jgi:hypothetical protein
MSELMCPFLPWDSRHNEFEGPCVVVKGDHCEVYQQLAERDNRIAELEKELEQMRTVALGYWDMARRLQESLDESNRYWDKALVEARKLTGSSKGD